MVFDLRRALLRKAEVESARLADFDFRVRARTFRCLADAVGLAGQGGELAALGDYDAALNETAKRSGRDLAEVVTHFHELQRLVHAALVEERGDPSPHRLA